MLLEDLLCRESDASKEAWEGIAAFTQMAKPMGKRE
jgi:hypothetical protein